MVFYKKIINPNATEWVLFIHGLGGSTKTWKYQEEKFGEKYNLIMVYLDGHGNSDYDDTTTFYKPNQMARTIKCCLDRENIDKVHIVSLSLGTIVALEFARIYPKNVLSIILAGSVINLDLKRKYLLSFAKSVQHIVPEDVYFKLFAYILLPRKNHKKSRDIFIRESKKLNHKIINAWLKGFELSQRFYQRCLDIIEKYKIPTLFISGNEDYMFLRGIKKLKAKVSNLNLKILENCGHVCSIEQADKFNSLSLEFLSRIEKIDDFLTRKYVSLRTS